MIDGTTFCSHTECFKRIKASDLSRRKPPVHGYLDEQLLQADGTDIVINIDCDGIMLKNG